MNALHSSLVALDWATLLYFVTANTFYAVLLISAIWEMRQFRLLDKGQTLWKVLGSQIAPSVSVISPAYNEESTIVESVNSLLALYYPNLEVLVVNDGSLDRTLAVLQAEFDLVPIGRLYESHVETNPVRQIYRSRRSPHLVVADKANGGKADALNAGLNLATGELVCAIDADTIIEPDALQRMVMPFIQNENVVAAGGTIRPVNGSLVQMGHVKSTRCPSRPLAGFQVIEYLRAFLIGRLGWNRLGGNLIISGAFGLFRRDAVLFCGGYLADTVGEDIELVAALRRRGYRTGAPMRVQFIPDPVAWTEVPESLGTLSKQRDRWHRGLADVLWRYKGVMFNPRYGSLGMIAYPYFLFVELLAPIVEAIGLVALAVGLAVGAVDFPFAILFLLLSYGYGLVLTVFTLVIDEINYHRYDRLRDRFLLLLWALAENLGYRQLTVIWRIIGLWKFVRGRKEWGGMQRKGFTHPLATR